MSVPAAQLPSDVNPGLGTSGQGSPQQQATWQQYMQLAIPPPLPSQSADSSDDSDSSDPTDQADQSQQQPAAQSLTPEQTAALGPPPTPPDLASVGAPTKDQSEQLTGLLSGLQSDLSDERADAKAYQADLQTEQAEDKKLTAAEIANLEQQPPAPPEQVANPLQRMAPLLLIAALGGKASKLDANAMLGATIGTVNGYLSGNQQAYENSTKAYDEAYKRFQERQEQQEKIFDTMREAYKGQADADQKALSMAHQLTGDDRAITQEALEAQEHYQTAAQTLKKNQYEMDKGNYDERVKVALAQKKEQAAAAKTAQQGLPLDSSKTADLAKQIAEYKAPMPTLSGFALRNPQSIAAISNLNKQVLALNPDFNQQFYSTAQKSRNAFTSGAQGNTVRSFNVLVNHLDTLQHLMNALNNGDVRAVNLASNEVARQFGVAPPTSFDAARRVVADEITKAVTGSAGALGDRQELQKNLSEGNSPAAMAGVIDTYKDLAGGQLYGLQQQYESGTQSKSFSQDLHLSPAAQALLQRATETSDTSQAAGKPVTATGPNGQKLILQNGKWVPLSGG
jgi:predicted transcriptional regulator